MNLKERYIKVLGVALLVSGVLPACSSLVSGDVIADIEHGYFKANVERLAIEFNLTPVIWDESIKECDWNQVTSYPIKAKTPEEVIDKYLQTQDFAIEVSKVDRHIKVIYKGPSQRLEVCS